MFADFVFGRPRKEPADYDDLARDRGFEWLGPEVPNTGTRTGWECEEGHIWEARYGSIRQGSGCPYCAGNAPKRPDDYRALAEKQGFKWLGPEVCNNRTKTKWKCTEGHIWEAAYRNIYQEYGCPICHGHDKKKTVADYDALAKKRGFLWLAIEVPPTTITDTRWKCQKGHRFEAPYHRIQQGLTCPTCSNRTPGKSRKKDSADYHALAKARGLRWIGSELPSTIRTKTIWVCEKGHQWEMAYHHIRKGKGCRLCNHQPARMPADYHALAKARGLRWLGPAAPNALTKTNWECTQGHQLEKSYRNVRQAVNGCMSCHINKRSHKPAHYHALAEKRGFRWIGPEVPNVGTKTVWECGRGHRWKATYNAIQQERGCPACAKRKKRPKRKKSVVS